MKMIIEKPRGLIKVERFGVEEPSYFTGGEVKINFPIFFWVVT